MADILDREKRDANKIKQKQRRTVMPASSLIAPNIPDEFDEDDLEQGARTVHVSGSGFDHLPSTEQV